jgi:hypothetical protein
VANVLILATSYDDPTWETNRWAHNLEQKLWQEGHRCTLVEGADVTRERLEQEGDHTDYILFYGHGEADRLYAQEEKGWLMTQQHVLVDATDLGPLRTRPLYAVCCHALTILGEAYGKSSPPGTFVGYGKHFGFWIRNSSRFEEIANKSARAFVNGKPAADIVRTLKEEWEELEDEITDELYSVVQRSPQERWDFIEASFSASVNARYVGTRPHIMVGSV